MKGIHFFYAIKPIVPRGIQLFLRRHRARFKREKYRDTWPINKEAAKAPEGWGGWPDNKKFALLLSHDVDTQKGHDRSLALMELEKHRGFRSSFNFVLEDYSVSRDLRLELEKNGFEVGAHGLHHDGKLFSSKKSFYKQLRRINHYLRDWGAVGFHAPATLRNLDWIVDLDIEYDSSTFDTDPFEPQPDGMHTIYPFCVTDISKARAYVELPYTLPQDHCLFVILGEKNNETWKRKLDWIVESGGMALLNTHPDYMNFDNTACLREQYPVRIYTEFLDYIRTSYKGLYWHPLPRDLARYWSSKSTQKECQIARHKREIHASGAPRLLLNNPKDRVIGAHVWIDLDNTPHVPFFIPVIRELESRGHRVSLTARDAFQVCELADKQGIPYKKIGRHYGKNPIKKILGLIWRAIQLLPFYLRSKPDVALSHGSRSQILLANLFGLPTILIMDYEHSRTIPLSRPRWEIVPEALRQQLAHAKAERVLYYRGIKEDVYVPDLKPNPSLLEELGLSKSDVIITVRPPADMAHYRNPESDCLMVEFMSRLLQTKGAMAVLLPRNRDQELAFRNSHPEWFIDHKTVVPSRVVDGLDLLWHSDLVVSGGGTMNREAAAMAIPVYSIFRGKIGAVDRALEKEGRLTLIQSPEEIWTKIQFLPRDKNRSPDRRPRPALIDIVDHIDEIIRKELQHSGAKSDKGTPKTGRDDFAELNGTHEK